MFAVLFSIQSTAFCPMLKCNLDFRLNFFQVETFGTMEKKEKVEFILEQMRLCFETKDYIRTQIISKKISTKYFESEETEELKLRYYRQMIDLNLHHKEYLAVSKNFYEIYSTPSVKSDDLKWKEVEFSVDFGLSTTLNCLLSLTCLI